MMVLSPTPYFTATLSRFYAIWSTMAPYLFSAGFCMIKLNSREIHFGVAPGIREHSKNPRLHSWLKRTSLVK